MHTLQPLRRGTSRKPRWIHEKKNTKDSYWHFLCHMEMGPGVEFFCFLISTNSSKFNFSRFNLIGLANLNGEVLGGAQF